VELVFSYGTLQKPDIQIAQFGRRLNGRVDALPGYAVRMSAVEDPKVAALIGEAVYANAEPAPNTDDLIEGTVFEITNEELAAADKYERDAGYERIAVRLRSGVEAWLYVRA
jgi:gamma-glutamylcyclotransferase (GGCT)/AIG2-like uncharacterized protein YtfP